MLHHDILHTYTPAREDFELRVLSHSVFLVPVRTRTSIPVCCLRARPANALVRHSPRALLSASALPPGEVPSGACFNWTEIRPRHSPVRLRVAVGLAQIAARQDDAHELWRGEIRRQAQVHGGHIAPARHVSFSASSASAAAAAAARRCMRSFVDVPANSERLQPTALLLGMLRIHTHTGTSTSTSTSAHWYRYTPMRRREGVVTESCPKSIL